MNKNNFYNIIIISAALACLLPADIVFSAPNIYSVSGEFLNGQSVVVSGTGFGMHADFGGDDNFLNYIFEDCEAGKIIKEPKWSVDGGGGWAEIQTAENKAGSNYNLFNERRADAETYTNAFGETAAVSYRYGIKTNVENTAPVHRYFYSMWIMFSENFGLVYGLIDGTGAKISMNTPFDDTGMKDYLSVGPSSVLDDVHLATNTENGDLSVQAGALNDFMPYGTWHRIDTFVSVPDETTGFRDEVSWWVDGKLIRTTTQSGFILQPEPDDVHKAGLISFMGFIDNPRDLPFYMRTDDFFLDFTKARLELSESSTWSEAVQVHKEIQIPAAWSDNSIEFTVNQGSFQNRDQAYLYIIDEYGSINVNGYQITFGGQAADTAPPDAPIGLVIEN